MTAQSHSDVYFGARENGEKVLEMSILSAFSMAEASDSTGTRKVSRKQKKNRTRTDKTKKGERKTVFVHLLCVMS